MNALGMIETRGLIAAIEACDVMLKTADVKLIGKRKSTATLVTILVTGDVGAVKASVEAGIGAAEKVSPGSVLSSHVIPRPIGEIEKVFGPKDGLNYPNKTKKKKSDEGSGSEPVIAAEETEKVEVVDVIEEATEVAPTEVDVVETVKTVETVETPVVPVVEELDKEALDKMATELALPEVMMTVEKLSVPKLRKLARQYDDLGIIGREISTANKKRLLKHFRTYYTRLQ